MPSLLALWSPVEVRRTLPVSRASVFAALADPTTYPEWLVGAQRIRHVDHAFPDAGGEFHHSVGLGGPATIDDSTESVAVEEDRRLVLEVRAGPFRGEVEFLLEAPRSGETELILRERPIGPGALLTPLLRAGLAARNQESLRQLEGYLLPSA